ncbi:MAG: 50S ribosomal protein L10 [Candidatus Levyibacteriota bacterium]
MNDKKVSANRQKKEVIVAEVTEKVGKAKAMVFTDYTGITHKQLEGLKKQLRSMDAEFAVTKNTLLKISLGEEKVKDHGDSFRQPTGTLFLYGDIVAPLKALAKMMKEFEKPQVKFGFLDGKAITDKEVLKLATLPSREVLLTQLVGMLNSPIQNLHRALNWNLQKFVMTLGAVAKKKSADTPAAPAEKPAEEVKVEAPAAAPQETASAISEVTEPATETPAPAVEAKEEVKTEESTTETKPEEPKA